MNNVPPEHTPAYAEAHPKILEMTRNLCAIMGTSTDRVVLVPNNPMLSIDDDTIMSMLDFAAKAPKQVCHSFRTWQSSKEEFIKSLRDAIGIINCRANHESSIISKSENARALHDAFAGATVAACLSIFTGPFILPLAGTTGSMAAAFKEASDKMYSQVAEHRVQLGRMESAEKLQAVREEAVKRLRSTVAIFEGLDNAESLVSKTDIGYAVRK